MRLPGRAFPRLLDLPLGGSLYDLLEEHYGTVPGEAEEHIEVVAAGEDEAVDPRHRRRARRCCPSRARPRTPTARVFEYSHDLFRADRTVITVRTPAADAHRRRPGPGRGARVGGHEGKSG